MGPILVSRALGKINQKMVCDPQNKFPTSVRDGLIPHPVVARVNICEKYLHGILQPFLGTGSSYNQRQDPSESETQALSGGLQIRH